MKLSDWPKKKMSNPSREKIKDLIHHIAYVTRDMDGFGRTKLYKVMWFFEAGQYTTTRNVFSGARFVRDAFGPRLKGFESLFRELEAEGRIRCFDGRYYNKTIKRVSGVTTPPAGLLNQEQARDLSYWIKTIADMTADEISEESHDYGWEIVTQGDEIPLSSVLAKRVREPNSDEVEWAKARARELGRL